MSIKQPSLGEDVKLQIIALTEHPVGGVDQSKSAYSEGRLAEGLKFLCCSAARLIALDNRSRRAYEQNFGKYHKYKY